jgi:peptide/nickel transport system permease protein
LGLDRPATERYWSWVRGMLTGDLGLSHAYSSPVSELIAERLWVTVPLAFMAMALTTVLAWLPAFTPPRATTSWVMWA